MDTAILNPHGPDSGGNSSNSELRSFKRIFEIFPLPAIIAWLVAFISLWMAAQVNIAEQKVRIDHMEARQSRFEDRVDRTLDRLVVGQEESSRSLARIEERLKTK